MHKRNSPRPNLQWTCGLTWEDGEAEPMDFETPGDATTDEAALIAIGIAAEDYRPGATVRNVRRMGPL